MLCRAKSSIPPSDNDCIDFLLPLRTEILLVLVANILWLFFLFILLLFEVNKKEELCMQTEKQTDDLPDYNISTKLA